MFYNIFWNCPYSNFTIQNQFYDQKYTLETLKSEYFQLKNLEYNNPKLIKENILQNENQIIIPIYHQINKLNIIKKIFFTELHNKYKDIIK